MTLLYIYCDSEKYWNILWESLKAYERNINYKFIQKSSFFCFFLVLNKRKFQRKLKNIVTKINLVIKYACRISFKKKFIYKLEFLVLNIMLIKTKTKVGSLWTKNWILERLRNVWIYF